MMKKIIGIIMMILPFIAMAVGITMQSGWVVALAIFSFVAFSAAWVVAATYLLKD